MAGVLKTRLTLLYKSYEDWETIKDTFIPLKGETCYCNVTTPVEGLAIGVVTKVGDGVHTFAELAWCNASADSITYEEIKEICK